MVWIIVAIVVVLILAAVFAVAQRRRRTQALQGRFGPEYDRTIERADSRRKAEAELREREERRAQLDIRPLSAASRERFASSWEATQRRFVDDPTGAVSEAHRLVIVVMRERGYPMDDFDQRAADISVDHPELVENYRAAHGISRRSESGQASTEELRQAALHYRSLFDELLGGGSGNEAPVRRTGRFERDGAPVDEVGERQVVGVDGAEDPAAEPRS
jgi:hypothetical protein